MATAYPHGTILTADCGASRRGPLTDATRPSSAGVGRGLRPGPSAGRMRRGSAGPVCRSPELGACASTPPTGRADGKYIGSHPRSSTPMPRTGVEVLSRPGSPAAGARRGWRRKDGAVALGAFAILARRDHGRARVGRRCFAQISARTPTTRKTSWPSRLLKKLGIHFALVSPTFGFRGCDDRRLGPCRGPARAAPPAGAVGRKAGHEPANGGD